MGGGGEENERDGRKTKEVEKTRKQQGERGKK